MVCSPGADTLNFALSMMGAYNTVSSMAMCPSCRTLVEVTVQFKFGNTSQLAYRLCDRLRWGGNDIGKPGKRKVIASGIAENACANCGYHDDWHFYVLIEEDVIKSVIPDADQSIFLPRYTTYVVLEE
jgi:hypothetical protein